MNHKNLYCQYSTAIIFNQTLFVNAQMYLHCVNIQTIIASSNYSSYKYLLLIIFEHIYGTLTGITTPSLSGPKSNNNEGV